MADDVVGSARIVITGDASTLGASFTAAQVAAQRAGAQVASAFSSAAAPIKGVSLIVDQFGRSISSAGAEATKAAPQVNTLAQAGNRLAAALLEVAGAEQVEAAATRGMASAHGEAVTQIQATSGALRVLEGSGGIRAAERFLTLIPGLGSALQFVFPVVGAIALASAFSKIAEESIDLKGKLEELKQATKETDQEFASLTRTIDQINSARIGRDFGPAQGLKANANAAAVDAQQDLERAKALRSQAANLKTEFDLNNGVNPGVLVPHFGDEILRAQQAQLDKLEQQAEGAEASARAKTAQVNKDREDAARTGSQELAAIRSSNIENEIRANTKIAEIAKLRTDIWLQSERNLALVTINADLDAHNRAVAAADLEVQLAKEKAAKVGAIEFEEVQKHIKLIRDKAAAESVGRTPNEVAKIQSGASGEIAGLRSGLEQSQLQAHQAVLEVSDKADLARVDRDRFITEEIIRNAQKRLDAINKEVEAIVAADLKRNTDLARVQGIGERSAGTQAGIGIESQKLALERAYGLEAVHTLREQLTLQQNLNALDEQARAAKIAGLDEAAKTALVAGDLVRWAQLAAEANQLSAESANKTYEAKTKELETAQKITLQYRLQAALGNAGKQIPGAIGNSVAAGVFSGNNIGQEITQALKGIGQQLLGQILTAAIEKLVIELGLNTLAQGVLQAVFGTAATAQVTATTANTVALAANTAALAAHGAVSAAGGVAGAAGGIAGAASGAAGAAASGLIGPLIAAVGAIIGGVISGVISATATLIGDAAIVHAINRTTAAVLSLKTIPNGATTDASSASGSANTKKPGGFSEWISGQLGFGALPVNIVAISPLAGVNGFLSIFGFADGGRPPVGVASIIGERGPELFIPDQSGTIVPAGQFGSAGLNIPRGVTSSSSSSQSIGEIHAHFHGITDHRAMVRELVKAVPQFLKSTAPVYSPLSR